MDSSTVEELISDQSHACLFLMVDDILNKTTQADFRKNVKHMIVKVHNPKCDYSPMEQKVM